jgi:fluoride ion exporter CrcB/FEX
MKKAGVPCVPGSDGPLGPDADLNIKIARDIGYPVIIKASGGGGGRGMRVVHAEAALLNAITVTQQEALAAEVVDPYEAQAHRNAMLLITGFCGGLSTFSALGLELHDLILSRHVLESTIAAAISVVLGLLAAWSGLWLGMRLNRHR